jgi:hypothetical protein
MIRIRYFSPVDNLSKSVYEFDDEKITVKYKSLTVESDEKIDYKIIKSIKFWKMAEVRWFLVSFVLIGSVPFLNYAFSFFIPTNPTLQIIEKAMIALGFVLCIPSLQKNELVSFLTSGREYLATIKVNKRDNGLFLDALKLIKRKTEITSETNPIRPFPDMPAAFEIVQRDTVDFLNKSISRFYEDRIVDFEKSLVEEIVTEVKYGDLSGKTQIIKTGYNKSEFVWFYLLIPVCFLAIPIEVFFPHWMDSQSHFVLGFSLFILTLGIYFLLKYLKKEEVLFYGKNDQVLYWTRRNTSNRETLDQIVKYIQDHIPPDKNEEDLSEKRPL